MPPPSQPPPTDDLTPAISGAAEPAMFATRPQERTPPPITAWLIAGVTVALIILGLVLFSRQGPKPGATSAVLPPAAGASSLTVSAVVMSEGISVSGGKYTYIDGHIQNHGSSTVTAITTQTFFANDAGSAPQVETTPLTLIRTRQPYVDVEPISAEPLKPGEDREFRLIFEGISPGWNQQIPEIRLVQISSR